jgi:hypothetical protein
VIRVAIEYANSRFKNDGKFKRDEPITFWEKLQRDVFQQLMHLYKIISDKYNYILVDEFTNSRNESDIELMVVLSSYYRLFEVLNDSLVDVDLEEKLTPLFYQLIYESLQGEQNSRIKMIESNPSFIKNVLESIKLIHRYDEFNPVEIMIRLNKLGNSITKRGEK